MYMIEHNSNRKILAEISETHWWYQARNNIINKVLSIYFKNRKDRSGKILDIGCGLGQLFSIWQKYGKIYGVEKDKESVSVCKTKYSSAIIWNDDFPDKHSMQYKYDLICMCDFLEHVIDARKVLEEVGKRLSPKGLLLITVPAYKWLWSEFDVKAGHKTRYTKKELHQELNNSNFKTIYLSYFMFLLFPLALLVRKLPPFKNGKSNQIEDLKYGSKGIINKLLCMIFSLEALYLGRKKILPLGLSILGLFEKTK